jgi:hypothetical protein
MICTTSLVNALPKITGRFPHSFPKIPIPIQLFHLDDLKVDSAQFFSEHKNVFNHLTMDPFDVRQERIEFLQSKFQNALCHNILVNYYVGKIAINVFQPLVDSLDKDDKEAFAKIQPFRFRAISKYESSYTHNDWSVSRLNTPHYFQNLAFIDDPEKIDFKHLPRVFDELDEASSQLPSFIQTIKGVCDLVKFEKPKTQQISVTVHHVRVYTQKNRQTISSPLGLYRDGLPFMASEIVVEKESIEGGDSEIFLANKKKVVFKTCLKPGFGLLQPDLDSDLCHHLTRIKPQNSSGYRSSLGFDLTILK